MPIYDIRCADCGFTGEVLHLAGRDGVACPACGGANTTRLPSATSGLTGRPPLDRPGANDKGCCGSAPAQAGCAGPGSCCGKGPLP